MRIHFSGDAYGSELRFILSIIGYTVRIKYTEDGVEFNHDATVRLGGRGPKGLNIGFTVWDDEKEEDTHEYFVLASDQILDMYIY